MVWPPVTHGDIEDEVAAHRLRSVSRSLEEFRAGSDPDYTNAFAVAATWSSDNRLPVFVPPSATAYPTAAPVVMGAFAEFMSTVRPTWTGLAAGFTPATVVRPAAGFPGGRGVFEFAADARGSGLLGLAIRGYQVGTAVHGVLFPGLTGSVELGVQIDSVDVYDFTGDGVHGGVRIADVRRLYVHECGGYGININDGWNDTTVQDVWSFYNKTGNLNIETSARLNFARCRFDRAGQPPYVANNQTDPGWVAGSQGIRIRGGTNISFVQCGTDANNGPGLDIQVESANPPNGQPWGISFTECQFIRDGQGAGTVTDAASTGVKLRGNAFLGGQTVGNIHFDNCFVTPAVSDDTAGTGPVNPSRAVWMENTEYCSWRGGWPQGNTKAFYFGASADPATANLNFVIDLPHLSTVTPTWASTPLFTTGGMTRWSGTVLQYWNGTAWTNV